MVKENQFSVMFLLWFSTLWCSRLYFFHFFGVFVVGGDVCVCSCVFCFVVTQSMFLHF